MVPLSQIVIRDGLTRIARRGAGAYRGPTLRMTVSKPRWRSRVAALPTGTVRDVVVGSGPEHEWAGDPRIRAIVGGLLEPDWMGRASSALSGGQARRVALAAALVAQPDVLLLDEPTNHLDLQSIRWLAQHLLAWPAGRRALVVVTHDRWFLDEVTTRT